MRAWLTGRKDFNKEDDDSSTGRYGCGPKLQHGPDTWTHKEDCSTGRRDWLAGSDGHTCVCVYPCASGAWLSVTFLAAEMVVTSPRCPVTDCDLNVVFCD